MEVSNRLVFTKRVVAVLIVGGLLSWIAANFALRFGYPRLLYWIYGLYFGSIALWSLTRIVRLLSPQKENVRT